MRIPYHTRQYAFQELKRDCGTQSATVAASNPSGLAGAPISVRRFVSELSWTPNTIFFKPLEHNAHCDIRCFYHCAICAKTSKNGVWRVGECILACIAFSTAYMLLLPISVAAQQRQHPAKSGRCKPAAVKVTAGLGAKSSSPTTLRVLRSTTANLRAGSRFSCRGFSGFGFVDPRRVARICEKTPPLRRDGSWPVRNAFSAPNLGTNLELGFPTGFVPTHEAR